MSGTIISAFERIAELIDRDDCPLCRAQDEHDVCLLPDFARIFRQVARELLVGKENT